MKQKILLMLCIATLGLASCKKDNIIEETSNRTIIVTINPADWEANADGSTFTASMDIPEVDQLNVDIEGVLVYLAHPENPNSYIAVPNTYKGNAYSFEQYYDNANSSGISIDLQRSEYSTQNPTRPSAPIRMKVVLIPSRDVT